MIVDQLQGLQEYSDRIPHIKAALDTFNGLAQEAISRVATSSFKMESWGRLMHRIMRPIRNG